MPEGNTRASRGRRIVLMIICVAALAGGGGAYWRWAQATEGARAPRLAARAAVSVSVEVVGRQDVPIYLTGLGTVQGSLTVGIHSQGDGKLQEVLFTEAQQAKKAQDVAQFTSASKDLERSKTLVKSNITSQQIVDQQQGKVDQLKASIE